jgi:hypothetical protein
MNLTGILKNVLLVVASVLIWHTPITLIQFSGYAIALVGMFYYSMGSDVARSHFQVFRDWLLADCIDTPYSRVPSDETVPARKSGDIEAGEGVMQNSRGEQEAIKEG